MIVQALQDCVIVGRVGNGWNNVTRMIRESARHFIDESNPYLQTFCRLAGVSVRRVIKCREILEANPEYGRHRSPWITWYLHGAVPAGHWDGDDV